MDSQLDSRLEISQKQKKLEDAYKSSLEYEEGNFPTNEEVKKMPYSNKIKNMFCGLKFVQLLKPCKNYNDGEEIIQYASNTIEEYKFILKRTFRKIGTKDHFKNPSILFKYIQMPLNEYIISRAMSSHPAGITVYIFCVLKFQNENLIVTEMIMEDAGTPLSKVFLGEGNSNPLKNVQCIRQIADVLNFMKKLGIYYADIKADNFLIDHNNNLRIIDYDISSRVDFAATIKTSQEVYTGCTHGYVSPEVYNKMNEKENAKSNISKSESKLDFTNKKENYDNWKADVYSLGILYLVLSNVLPFKELGSQIDKFKINEKEHLNIEYLIYKIKITNDKQSTQKLRFILKNCLCYENKKRLTFKLLSKFLSDVFNKDIKLEDMEKELKHEQENPIKESNVLEKEIKEKTYENYLFREKIRNLILEKQTLEINNKNLVKINEKLEKLNSAKDLVILSYEKQRNNIFDLVKKFINEEISPTKCHKTIEDLFNKILIINQKIKYVKIDDSTDDIIQISKEKLEIIFNEFKALVPRINNNSINSNIHNMNQNLNKIQKSMSKTYDELQYSIINATNANIDSDYRKVKVKVQEDYFWEFVGKLISNDDLPTILAMLGKTQKLKILEIPEMENLDQDQNGILFFDAILKNHSIVGINLYNNSLPEKIKENILNYFFKNRANAKYLILEKKDWEEKASKIAKKFNLELNNWEAYKQYYCCF